MNLPNKLTVGRLLLCLVFTLVLELSSPYAGLLAFFIFVVASLTDWLDGYLARRLHLVTDLGKLLDPLADKILVSAAYIGLVAHNLAPAWIVVFIISREFLITGLRMLAASKGVIMAAERMGKHKTISQIVTVLIGLALLSFHQLNWLPAFSTLMEVWLLKPLLWLTLFITIYSGAAYFVKNYRMVLAEQ